MNSTLHALAAEPAQPATHPASPHRMVAMLLDGALDRLTRARSEMLLGGGQSLPAAVSIIEALQGSLDLDRGGQLAVNLFELYDYMLRRLDEARGCADATPLLEVASLLGTIREGWEAIAPEV